MKGEETNEDFVRTIEDGGYKYLYRGFLKNKRLWWNHLNDLDGLSPMDNIKYLKNEISKKTLEATFEKQFFLKKTLVKLRLKRLGYKNPFFVLYLAIRGINNWAPKEANYVSQHCAFLRQMQTTATARKRGSVHSLWQINHCLGLGHRIGGNDYEAVEGNFWWVTKAALNRSLARQNFF